MKKILFFLLALGSGFLLFLFFSILILNYSSFRDVKIVGERICSKEEILLSGRTLFVSDLHIDDINDLDFDLEGENIVIVGDLFNSESGFFNLGKSNEERFKILAQNLVKDSSDRVNIYYVSASKFHDAFIGELKKEFEKVKFYSIGKEARFSLEGVSVVVLHGDQFNNTGVVPCAVSYFSGLIFREPLLVEKIFKSLSGINNDTWLISGHSHVPALDSANRVANCGSRTGVPFFGQILQIPKRTGVLFDGGKASIIRY